MPFAFIGALLIAFSPIHSFGPSKQKAELQKLEIENLEREIYNVTMPIVLFEDEYDEVYKIAWLILILPLEPDVWR